MYDEERILKEAKETQSHIEEIPHKTVSWFFAEKNLEFRSKWTGMIYLKW